MATRIARRLPGFRFEVQSPPLRETLPRMDIAVFVGFAASGPLHTPVPVEDMAHFTAIFGADVALAWDTQHGTPVTAYLAPAVRAFFRNGGRRCWVVRVAGEAARANVFPIPGLLRAAFDEVLGSLDITPALAQARSEGSWSDALRVGTTLRTRPVAVSHLLPGGLGADLDAAYARRHRRRRPAARDHAGGRLCARARCRSRCPLYAACPWARHRHAAQYGSPGSVPCGSAHACTPPLPAGPVQARLFTGTRSSARARRAYRAPPTTL